MYWFGVGLLWVAWIICGSIVGGMRIAHHRHKGLPAPGDFSTALVVLMGPIAIWLVGVPIVWEGLGNPLTLLARWLGGKD